MRFLDLFKRKPAQELPADVAAAIEGAHIVLRPHGEEGECRAVVQVAGHRSGWIHSPEEDARHMAALWPELSAGQLARASYFMAAKVRQRFRDANAEQDGYRPTYANRFSRASYERAFRKE